MRAASTNQAEMARIAGDSFDGFAALNFADVADSIDAVIYLIGADGLGVQTVHGITIAANDLANGFAVF